MSQLLAARMGDAAARGNLAICLRLPVTCSDLNPIYRLGSGVSSAKRRVHK